MRSSIATTHGLSKAVIEEYGEIPHLAIPKFYVKEDRI